MGPLLPLVVALGLAVSAASTATAPLRERLVRLAPDPAPETITNGTHYLTSNERRLDLFAPWIRDVGGIHLGVGSDPNYLFAGWARSELMVIVDFDQDVVDLHALHVLFLACAQDGTQYAAYWDTDRLRAEALVAMRFVSPLRRARMLELFARAREEVAARLAIMKTKLTLAGETWFLDEDADFEHVSRLAATGRIVAVRGDFTHPGVVQAIGEAIADRQRFIGTLYLSNIEQYFMYGAEYRGNMLGLPLDHRTVVMRTLPARPAGFEYVLQAGDNFHRWLRSRRATSVYRVRGLGKGEHLTASELFVIDAEPPAGALRGAARAHR